MVQFFKFIHYIIFFGPVFAPFFAADNPGCYGDYNHLVIRVISVHIYRFADCPVVRPGLKRDLNFSAAAGRDLLL